MGRILATIIIQEGPSVKIFTPALTEYLVSGSADGIITDPTEATDGHVRFGLEKVCFGN